MQALMLEGTARPSGGQTASLSATEEIYLHYKTGSCKDISWKEDIALPSGGQNSRTFCNRRRWYIGN
jgi:hypothetical protein